ELHRAEDAVAPLTDVPLIEARRRRVRKVSARLRLALEGEDADVTALLIRSQGGKKANRAVLIRRVLERCHDIAVAAELMLARPKVRVQADGSGCEDLRARGGLTMEDISANRPRRDGMIFRCEAEDDARGLGTDRRLRGGRGDSKRHS